MEEYKKYDKKGQAAGRIVQSTEFKRLEMVGTITKSVKD